MTDIIVEPYLHVYDWGVYNPLTDRTLTSSNALYKVLCAYIERNEHPASTDHIQMLVNEGWLLPLAEATATRFLLKYVSLEANVACNQACYFCPVSFKKRKDGIMPLEFYETIVQQLTRYKNTIQGVFMNHYNEPTIDRYFLSRIRILKKYGFDIGLLTNGTGLTPKRVDKILNMGGIRHLCINLSTIDPSAYHKDRGSDHLRGVLRNIDFANQHPIGKEMLIVVLGLGDQKHDDNYANIQERFKGSNFEVRYEIASSRGYHLPIGQSPTKLIEKLAGCEQTGSRVLQHLHITAEGKAILCCQDYHSEYEVGDLRQETIHEILQGDRMATMRRWVYGLDDAPKNFICRSCIFALQRRSLKKPEELHAA